MAAEQTLVLTKDERSGSLEATRDEATPEVGTIAAIVTSLGGGAAAVGIVRLSGPTAVAVAARVFRPAGRAREASCAVSWRPRSHFVEYGFALDQKDNVIDEVVVVSHCFSMAFS